MNKTVTIDLDLWNRLTRERRELREALKNLEEYARLVKSDISDKDTGWYYQFQQHQQIAARVLTRTQED